jgi:hypothetical protein
VESKVARKRNLAKKIDDSGNPIVMKFITKVAYHSMGVLCHKPQTCQKSRVPYRRAIQSTRKNSDAVVKQWATSK